jgi:hypothetical protein
MPSINLALDFCLLAADPELLSGLPCLGCHDLLTIHQPDVESPDRLLGVCPECRAWFLVEATSGVMVRLPDQDALREI